MEREQATVWLRKAQEETAKDAPVPTCPLCGGKIRLDWTKGATKVYVLERGDDGALYWDEQYTDEDDEKQAPRCDGCDDLERDVEAQKAVLDLIEDGPDW